MRLVCDCGYLGLGLPHTHTHTRTRTCFACRIPHGRLTGGSGVLERRGGGGYMLCRVVLEFMY